MPIFPTLLATSTSVPANGTGAVSLSASSSSLSTQDESASETELIYFGIRCAPALSPELSTSPVVAMPRLAGFSDTSDFQVGSPSIETVDYDWTEEFAPVPETSTYLAALFASAALTCWFPGRKLRCRRLAHGAS